MNTKTKTHEEWLRLARSESLLDRKKVKDELSLLGYSGIDIMLMEPEDRAKICAAQTAKED